MKSHKSVWKNITQEISRNHAEIPMTSTWPSQDAGKATLDLQVMATLASHLRHGPSHVRAPKIHSTGDMRGKEECGHKQISHNKFVWRFQIQGFLTDDKQTSAMYINVGPNDLSRRHVEASMQKIVYTLTTYSVHAALLGSHAQNFIPNWVAICFPLGFPDFVFLATGADAHHGLAMQKKHTNQTWELHGTPLTDENWGYIRIFSAFPSVRTTKPWAFFKKNVDSVCNRKYVVASSISL